MEIHIIQVGQKGLALLCKYIPEQQKDRTTLSDCRNSIFSLFLLFLAKMFGPDSRFSDFMANFLTFCEKSGMVGCPTVPDLVPPIAVYPLRRRRTIISLLPRGRSCRGPCCTSSLRHPSSLHGTSFYCIHSLHRCNHLC